MDQTRILFVCLGNICRSPLAEGILRHRAAEGGFGDRLIVDSAGTGGWHQGEGPDPRSVAAARDNGIDISGLRARQVKTADFSHFDMIFAMDRANLRDLVRRTPHDSSADLHLFMDFVGSEPRDVPDPYYGDAQDFDRVFRMLDEGCTKLLATLFRRQGQAGARQSETK
ncbi:low molecular weight protein-tyrosine-phosphatase [Rhizobium alvei]|uniref:protein-tyrosine-phosphatase n=1 Tax=Rhizobium alvei TaxID=1132659 RepID=A0ABT8YNH5_9HYPH|nr:low molecular weight protein-tyrosine-phosphatase [Rhizobium alvei]MDO6964854.1 low molecular weight protein-tyrosine-phosphatase [Rhizobium alvei]